MITQNKEEIILSCVCNLFCIVCVTMKIKEISIHLSSYPMPSLYPSSSTSSSLSSSLFTSSLYYGTRKPQINKRINGPIKTVVLMRFVLPILALILQIQTTNGAITQKDYDQQMFRIFQARLACNRTITSLKKPDDGAQYCEPIWDNVMCWPNYTPAGRLAQQPCAGYIDGFNTKEKAHRFCMPDGTWAIHPNLTINNSWTNFLDCVKRRKKVSTINPDIAHHMPKITLISTVGYSISLVFLLVATVLMVGLKKLHCQRNTIHINLFLSFIFRAAVSLVRNGALVKGFAFSWDFDYDADGTVVFNEDKSHWECKILNVLHQYALEANYTWIFVEGLYLHTLIFFAVFSQTKKFFKVYIIIGWSIPLIFVITWVLLRIYKNDVLCWNTHKKNYYWVLEAPIIASITVNFFFFLNIIRVLFTKIRNCNSRDPRRFRKLAKSTLVLIPLFGVYYIIFIILARHKSPDIAIVHLYLEMTLNSFQGIVVAFLFCFLNEEVRLEVKKKWNRHMLSRRYSSSSRRSSHAFSTSSFILRERFSLSHTGSPVNDNNGKNHLTNLDRPIFDNSGDKIETKPIPRVPSESKVTFNLLNNIEHQNGSPLPKEYKPRNNIIKKETVPTVTEDSENHSYPPLCDEDLGVEFELLIPEKGLEDDNLIQESCSLSLSNTDDSRNKYNGVAQKSLTRSHSSSPAISPTSNTFPSSNGLSLVKDPTYLLQQMKAKDI